MPLVFKDDDAYVLVYSEPGTDKLVLETICGTSGLFSVAIELNEDESGRFREDNSEAAAIALQICKDPAAFTNRRVPESRLIECRR